ncbi:MAG: GNAT family N-acetyltransferase [Clostridiales bacterium]|nr:GNAT family N-acetyltransferase [Clostridiales bacterium]
MKQLETKRLILRKFKESDFAAVQSYASCPENIIFMVWGPNSEEETKSFIRTAIAKADEVPCRNFQYAVTAKDTGKLIGACDISISGEEGAIGWILHRDFWRQGYAAEMGAVLLDFGFGELGLHRITATCDEENTASYKVMEKIGMRREGMFLDARPANKISCRQYGDELSYAIVKDEWEARKESDYYNSLPCVFNGFIEMPLLQDGEIRLVRIARVPQWHDLYTEGGYRRVNIYEWDIKHY